METIDTKEYKGYTIEIYADSDSAQMLYDEYIDNSDGHLDYFTTVGAWGDYNLFDHEQKYMGERLEYATYFNDQYNVLEPTEYELTDNEIDRVIKWVEKNIIMLPIYVYEHSGIALSTGGFSCPWDSGQAGFIYTDKKRAREWLGVKSITKQVEKKIIEMLSRQVAYMNDLAQGNVYGFVWDFGGCGGYVGDSFDDMYREAQTEIDYYIEQETKKHVEERKVQIKKHVPLQYRQALTN